MIGAFRWTWPHFRPHEMADSETGELVLVPAFMDWLEVQLGIEDNEGWYHVTKQDFADNGGAD